MPAPHPAPQIPRARPGRLGRRADWSVAGDEGCLPRRIARNRPGWHPRHFARQDFVLPSKILFCEGGLGTDWDWDWDWVWDWDWEGLKIGPGILFVVRAAEDVLPIR